MGKRRGQPTWPRGQSSAMVTGLMIGGKAGVVGPATVQESASCSLATPHFCNAMGEAEVHPSLVPWLLAALALLLCMGSSTYCLTAERRREGTWHRGA
jgi:hypothetical protein